MAVSKRIRFEVFKRDSFRCQYCGQAAPDVMLQVDHIVPRSKGGVDDILNLVTSCQACNGGKSDRLLSDTSVAEKARVQAEELQERQNQIEMMLKWKRGLQEQKDLIANRLAEWWNIKLKPIERSLNEFGMKALRKLLARGFTPIEIIEAMDVAADYYFELDRNAKPSIESVDRAFNKIGGIAYNKKYRDVPPEPKAPRCARCGVDISNPKFGYRPGATLCPECEREKNELDTMRWVRS